MFGTDDFREFCGTGQVIDDVDPLADGVEYVYVCYREVAKLCGFPGRKSDRKPGRINPPRLGKAQYSSRKK